jgi:pimeloyl-ACP methyl ester carboxylesterase
METVESADGSTIAYDRYGAGPSVILVAGALGYRKFKRMEQLAELLADRCTVINYDRRGRGDSTEDGPFAVEREIEDLAALIEAAGGSAALWGWSSGGALALRAAAAGIAVERVSVYEVPFMVDPGHQPHSAAEPPAASIRAASSSISLSTAKGPSSVESPRPRRS